MKHFLRRPTGGARTLLPQGRILVTWMYDNFRVNELVLPVLEELEPEQCVVIGGTPEVLSRVPGGAAAVSWDQAMHFDAAAWCADYRKDRAAWQQTVRVLCRKHRLPPGAYDRLAFHILVATRELAGCLEFLVPSVRRWSLPTTIATTGGRAWRLRLAASEFPRFPWSTASSMIRRSLLFRSWPTKFSVGVKANAGNRLPPAKNERRF